MEKKDASIIGTLLAVFIGVLTGWIQIIDKKDSVAWEILLGLTILSSIAIIFYIFFNRIKSIVIGRNKLGIIRVYSNRNNCSAFIKKCYKDSRKAKIFVLRGTSDFVSTNTSLFEDLSLNIKECQDKKQEPGSVKVLLCSPSSKFITERKINNSAKYTTEIKNVTTRLDIIQTKIALQYKFYTDSMLCKFYLFDDKGFLIFNDRDSKLDENTSVIFFKKNIVKDDNKQEISIGIYSALERYFDFIWNNTSKDIN